MLDRKSTKNGVDEIPNEEMYLADKVEWPCTSGRIHIYVDVNRVQGSAATQLRVAYLQNSPK